MYAYVSSRAERRGSLKDEPRHAVDEISHLCGAHDTMCGKPVTLYLGDWDPDAPGNCRRCIRAMADRLSLGGAA